MNRRGFMKMFSSGVAVTATSRKSMKEFIENDYVCECGGRPVWDYVDYSNIEKSVSVASGGRIKLSGVCDRCGREMRARSGMIITQERIDMANAIRAKRVGENQWR